LSVKTSLDQLIRTSAQEAKLSSGPCLNSLLQTEALVRMIVVLILPLQTRVSFIISLNLGFILIFPELGRRLLFFLWLLIRLFLMLATLHNGMRILQLGHPSLRTMGKKDRKYNTWKNPRTQTLRGNPHSTSSGHRRPIANLYHIENGIPRNMRHQKWEMSTHDNKLLFTNKVHQILLIRDGNGIMELILDGCAVCERWNSILVTRRYEFWRKWDHTRFLSALLVSFFFATVLRIHCMSEEWGCYLHYWSKAAFGGCSRN